MTKENEEDIAEIFLMNGENFKVRLGLKKNGFVQVFGEDFIGWIPTHQIRTIKKKFRRN